MIFRNCLLGLTLLAINGLASGDIIGLWESTVNYERTFQCPEAEVVAPENEFEVQAIVQRAIESGRKVMTGTKKFNSQIDAACAGMEQIQITTEKLNHIVHVDTKNNLVTAQAGVRLYQLNDELRRYNLSINMISEGGFFSIGGMLGSDTHGSTMHQGVSLSEYIKSVKVVDGLGRIREITGDELLAYRVNLGVLGVLVDATFQVEPLKKVKAEIIEGSDKDLAESIMKLPLDHYSASVSWFPGIRSYTATLYDFVPYSTPGEAVNKQAEVPDWAIKAFRGVYQYANQPNRPFAECSLAKIRKSLRATSFFKDNGKTMAHPVGWSDDMQYFKCNKNGTCPWDILPIVVGGFAIPLDQLPAWIEDVKSIVDAHSTLFNRPCFALNGIYFRFGRGTDAWLAMNQGQDTVFIDLEYVVNTKDSSDDGEKVTINRTPKSYDVTQEIEQLSLQKYNARPHWGKNQAAAFYQLSDKQYPQWNEFLEYKKKIDPQGTFTNPWWERITSKDTINNSLGDNCALDGECICRTDDHCPGDLVCRPGKFWKSARICTKP